MSNLSDIGFPVKSEQDVNQVIMDVMPHLSQIPCPPRGFYYKFSDESGAELFLQGNTGQDILGFNPAFNGKSRRLVGLTTAIERDTSELDGAFKAVANPSDQDIPEDSGDFEFVFDLPDFRMHEDFDVQTTLEVQLTAFASNDFQVFSSSDNQTIDPNSFVASGLNQVTPDGDAIPPQAHAKIVGEIKDFELRTNTLTRSEFYWFLIETQGGEIDIVADPNLITTEPEKGGIVSGSFWLSGKLIKDESKTANIGLAS